MMEFIRWRDTVVKQVRFRPDRKAIRQELNDHYEDKVADLERLGYDRKLAESRALEGMGDAEEIGKALNKVHKPWLGWLGVATTCLAAVLVLVTVWNVWIGGGYIEIQNHLGLMPDAVDYQADGDTFYLSKREETERIYWRSLSEKVERSGVTIELPYMAIWSDPADDGTPIYWLEFVITAKDARFWEDGPDLSEMVMESSGGRMYRRYTTGGSTEVWPIMMSRRETLFGTVYEVTLHLGFEPQKWLEITYPHGEPWTFRLDWEEVDLG